MSCCGKAAKKAGAIMTGFTRLATDEIGFTEITPLTKSRIAICHTCENRTKVWFCCNICKCFIIAKARVESEKCPLGKWLE
jgi:hypothetical protein